MKAIIDHLIIEVTRNCNMECEHCLRGENHDQHVDTMPEEVMERVFEQVEGVTSITITGGEPGLAVNEIKTLYNLWKDNGLTPHQVYLATNGSQITDDFLSVLDAIYIDTAKDYLGQDGELDYGGLITTARWMQDMKSEACDGLIVELSCDEYHGPISVENFLKLASRSYLSYGRIPMKPDYGKTVIAEGRNADGHLPNSYKKPKTLGFYVEDEGDGVVCIETLYVSANGNLAPDCDLSYDRIDEGGWGNVMDENWLERIVGDGD